MYGVFVEDFMNEDVKYVYHDMTYGELKALLQENKKIKRFPLVDSHEDMILLGSIDRLDLVDAIENQIGRERRLYIAAIRQKQARFNLRRLSSESHKRRSRDDISSNGDARKDEETLEYERTPNRVSDLADMELFTEIDPKHIVTSSNKRKTRIRRAFEVLFKDRPPFDRGEFTDNYVDKDLSKPRIIPITEYMPGRLQQPLKYIQDMTPAERKLWEAEELAKSVNFALCKLDPAPFQLVIGTSLLKVHSFFSMIGINYAYVTSKSRLVGVVGVKELRKVIQDVNNNKLPTPKAERHLREVPDNSSQTTADVNDVETNRANVINMEDPNDESLGDGEPTSV